MEHDYNINTKTISWTKTGGSTSGVVERTSGVWDIDNGSSTVGVWNKNATWEIELTEPTEYTIEYLTKNMWATSYTDVFELILDGKQIVRTTTTINDTYTTTLTAGKHTLYASFSKESGVAGVRACIYIYDISTEMTSTPTCTEDGSRELKCSRCGDIKSEIVAALGHNYVNYKCTRCGILDPTHNHNYEETIVKEPTCIMNGEKKFSCICGDVYTETISATGHDYVNYICSKCGDVDSNHNHTYIDGECTVCGCTQGAGLYDENDNLIVSWHDLITEYGLDITVDATGSSDPTTMSYILKNNPELSTGTKLIIDNSVTKIGNYAFYYYCKSIKEVKFPSGLESIGQYAFADSGLTYVEIPDSVTILGASAFSNSTSIESIKLPKNQVEAGINVFNRCLALKEVTIPDGWTNIPSYMFTTCGLETVYLPDTITSIEKGAFSYCSSLATIVSPKELTHIGESAFRNCTSLKSFYIPNNCVMDGTVVAATTTTAPFYGCSSTLELYVEFANYPYVNNVQNTTFNVYVSTYSSTSRKYVFSRVVTHWSFTREDYEATLLN